MQAGGMTRSPRHAPVSLPPASHSSPATCPVVSVLALVESLPYCDVSGRSIRTCVVSDAGFLLDGCVACVVSFGGGDIASVCCEFLLQAASATVSPR